MTRLVIKHGGSVHGRVDDVVLEAVARHTGEVALVHGGGAEIGRALERAGMASKFVDGLRVTPPEAVPIVERALLGVNARIVRELARLGRPARGVDGRSGHFFSCEQAVGSRGEELGCVGRLIGADPVPLKSLWAAGITPVIAPLGLVAERVCNVNADEVAGAIAGALGVGVVFITDVPGVSLDGVVCEQLTVEEVSAAVAAGQITGGMIPKTAACVGAIRMGAPYAAIVPATSRALEPGIGTAIVEAGRGTGAERWGAA